MAAAEPERAEAWFYLGAAYGVRAQFRVYRVERLAAARDGKRIKESLEKALALDPAMHDAEFGIGMYRYYAGVAPAIFRFLRFLLLLPGGDRAGRPAAARTRRPARAAGARRSAVPDPRAVSLVRAQVEGGAGASSARCRRAIRTTRCSGRSRRRSSTSTFTITAASLKASEHLLALAQSRAVFRADIAERRNMRRARNIATRNRSRSTRAIASQPVARARTRAHTPRRTRSDDYSLCATSRHVFMKV